MQKTSTRKLLKTNLLILLLGKPPKKMFFLGLCPKLWVGGGRESLTFGEVSDLHVYMVFWVILSVIFPLKVLNVRGRWVGSAIRTKP